MQVHTGLWWLLLTDTPSGVTVLLLEGPLTSPVGRSPVVKSCCFPVSENTSLSCFCFWKIVSLGIELWVGMVCISCSVWTIFLLSLACLVSPAKPAFLLFVSVASLSLVWSSLSAGPLSLCLCSGLRLYAFITFATSLRHFCPCPPPPPTPAGTPVACDFCFRKPPTTRCCSFQF